MFVDFFAQETRDGKGVKTSSSSAAAAAVRDGRRRTKPKMSLVM